MIRDIQGNRCRYLYGARLCRAAVSGYTGRVPVSGLRVHVLSCALFPACVSLSYCSRGLRSGTDRFGKGQMCWHLSFCPLSLLEWLSRYIDIACRTLFSLNSFLFAASAAVPLRTSHLFRRRLSWEFVEYRCYRRPSGSKRLLRLVERIALV